MQNRFLIIGAGALFIIGAAVVSVPAPQPHVQTVQEHESLRRSNIRNEPIQPLLAALDLDEGKVSLGRVLFHDTRLSVDDSVSCASCHDLQMGGADNRPVSIGVQGKEGIRNAPTVFNASLNFRQFWDGRARTLEEQIEGPLFNEAEMGWDTWAHLLEVLSSQEDLKSSFGDVFSDGLTKENLIDAITTFERSLITIGSPFDRWLRHEDDAMTERELEGYQLFKDVGCIACHQGKNVGGNLFQRVGRIESTEFEEGDDAATHLGRFDITGKERDRYRFKVPTLRNIELTAPYLHNGSIQELSDVIQFMAKHQLGAVLNDEEVDLIERFLLTLTGDLPASVSR
ncbi:MAG: cytochrome c peroxidase [Glaciecola sp.]|jgi:cytochrome c peroxidase